MKIAAWSDGHGVLPKIKEYADVLIIAGDFTPLNIQRQTNECLKWFTNEFFNYVRKVNCKKVLLVPGNHDFLCERISPEIIKEMIENNADIKDKLVYLIDEEYQYDKCSRLLKYLSNGCKDSPYSKTLELTGTSKQYTVLKYALKKYIDFLESK